MKKKLFRSFIVSLFVFTLFISVSKAEIVANKICDPEAIQTYNPTSYSVSDLFPAYTNDSFISLLEACRNDLSEQNFNNIWSLFNNIGYGNVHIQVLTSGRINLHAYSDEHDFGVGISANDTPLQLITDNGLRYEATLLNDNSLTIKSYRTNNSSGFTGHRLDCLSGIERYKLTKDAKKLSIVSTKLYYETYQWDGVSYYSQAPSEPEVPAGPEFATELTDDEIASVVQNFSNSTYWKNRNSNYTGFFIQRNELNGYYAVYVVPYIVADNKSLDGIYIPAGISSSNFNALDYDSYSILFNDGNMGVVLPWQQWLREFKAYLSPDGVNFEYYGEIHMKEFGEQRIPMTTPIIYSNFVIPFKTLLGDTTNSFDEIVDSFTEEEEFNFSDLINSETGESYEFEDVPVVDDPVTHALREFFTDLIGYLSSAFELVISKIFNFSEYLLSEFGENVFTLLFAIIIEAFSALVAGISLLVRFAGFVLTLVAIPADSSLFNVLVDGSAWGIHFIEGLNFLKGLSWNNLNLWTFFECFVAALEVIWTVKIVRRHYSQVV